MASKTDIEFEIPINVVVETNQLVEAETPSENESVPEVQ